MNDRYQLHLGDCLEVLKSLPDGSVDAVITDPPYGTASASKVQTKSGVEVIGFNHAWDSDLPLEWVGEALRCLRSGGSLIAWTDTKALTVLWERVAAMGGKPLQCLFWHKLNPPPQPRKNYQSAVEAAVFARKEGKVLCWNGGGATQNIIQCGLVGGHEANEHPTQKPLKVMRWCASAVVDEGMTILDPFMGSGTTGVAALQMGCKFIGCEIEPKYFNIAKRRIEAEARQKTMDFGGRDE